MRLDLNTRLTTGLENKLSLKAGRPSGDNAGVRQTSMREPQEAPLLVRACRGTWFIICILFSFVSRLD